MSTDGYEPFQIMQPRAGMSAPGVSPLLIFRPGSVLVKFDGNIPSPRAPYLYPAPPPPVPFVAPRPISIASLSPEMIDLMHRCAGETLSMEIVETPTTSHALWDSIIAEYLPQLLSLAGIEEDEDIEATVQLAVTPVSLAVRRLASSAG